NTMGLTCGKTYEVDVRVSFNGGSTWCHSSDPYGDVCLLTTVCGGAMALEGTDGTAAEARVAMYPNPNRGDQLFLSLSQLEEGVETVSIDIYDGFGKRAITRTIAAQDGFLSTVLDLEGSLANGLYMVSITAGSSTFNERLVIQK
ncbi:MAG: T9SS type A sorting domain-containing protein, partial [Flavobacteriales bacterium]